MIKSFIKTKDPEMAEKLANMGFKQVIETSNDYVFINSDSIKLNFSEGEMKKIYFTNRMVL